jgi:hypothetical protein
MDAFLVLLIVIAAAAAGALEVAHVFELLTGSLDAPRPAAPAPAPAPAARAAREGDELATTRLAA